MSFATDHLLSVIVFLPLAAAAIAMAFPRGEHTGVRGFAVAATLIDFGLACSMWQRFDPRLTYMQFAENLPWISSMGIHYSVGVDGISVLLVLLVTFLMPIVVLSTYGSVQTGNREYMVCLLMLQTAMLGGFVATDLFLFYVFWEATLVPSFFLIGIWGGRRRLYAALKFFLYTFAGSLLMLAAIIYVVWNLRQVGAGGVNFSFSEIASRLTDHPFDKRSEMLLFAAFALAFAVKVPLFPLHTWLPDAYSEAPTGATVLLSGALVKLGAYGLLRYPLMFFPEAAVTCLPALGALAVIGILYAALCAMVQTDIKRVIAYSSISHLGFIVLGIAAMTPLSVAGGVLQMVNHGISTGALFLLVGVLAQRRKSRELVELGGLAKSMPLFATVFVFMALSSMGLPGLNGFVGEFMILSGTYASSGIAITASTATVALIFSCIIQLAVISAALFTALVVLKSGHKAAQSRLSQSLVVASAVFFTWLLAAPLSWPLGGGLLLRPLRSALQDSRTFKEVFAGLAVLAALGVILAAIYLLQAVQRTFFGPPRDAPSERLFDLRLREVCMFAPLMAMALLIGVYPQPFIDTLSPAATHYAQTFRERARLPAAHAGQRAGLPKLPLGPAVGAAPYDPGLAERQRQLPWRRRNANLDTRRGNN